MNTKKIVKVCAGFVLKDGKMLLIKQDKGAYENLLWFPAGRKEENETLKQCVKREVKEETGFLVNTRKLISKNIFHFKDATYEIHIFRCELTGGKKQTSFEIKNVYWKNPEELLENPKNVVPLVLDAIIRLKHFNEL
ncbi:MAG: NUDIX hydrolase, partial [Nanoarchaeota archaeon]|nr:NUDIX hydrolase [Nanoarchaeota archaeon]